MGEGRAAPEYLRTREQTLPLGLQPLYLDSVILLPLFGLMGQVGNPENLPISHKIIRLGNSFSISCIFHAEIDCGSPVD